MSHRAPIQKIRESRSTLLLQLVHSDVLGPIDVPSLGKARYFVTFIDDFSKWTLEFIMKRNSEVPERFKTFKALAENQTSHLVQKLHVHEVHGPLSDDAVNSLSVKVLRYDNGGEYLSRDFKQFLSQFGIHHQLSITNTPNTTGRLSACIAPSSTSYGQCSIKNHFRSVSGRKLLPLPCTFATVLLLTHCHLTSLRITCGIVKSRA